MNTLYLTDLECHAMTANNMTWGLGHPTFHDNPEIRWGYHRFLHWFVSEHKPELVIECGVYMGTATEHMALGNPDTLVVGVDIHPHNAFYNVVRRNRNVRFVQGNSVYSLDTVKTFAENRKLGLLFLDSTHDGVTAQAELDVYSELMDDECLVAADDIRGYPAMIEWWESIQYPKIDLSFLHEQENELGISTGFGVFIVRR